MAGQLLGNFWVWFFWVSRISRSGLASSVACAGCPGRVVGFPGRGPWWCWWVPLGRYVLAPGPAPWPGCAASACTGSCPASRCAALRVVFCGGLWAVWGLGVVWLGVWGGVGVWGCLSGSGGWCAGFERLACTVGASGFLGVWALVWWLPGSWGGMSLGELQLRASGCAVWGCLGPSAGD